MLFHPFDFGHLKDREISQKYNQAFPVAYNRSIHPSKFWSQLALISVSVPKSFSLSCFLDIFPGKTHQSPPLSQKNRIFSTYTRCLITTAVFSQIYGLSSTCAYLQGVPKKSIFLKFQDRKCIWKIWTVLDHVR